MFQLIDAIVALLKCPLAEDAPDWNQVSDVYRTAYEVLYTYTLGKSKKNALYFGKYIDFFTTQLGRKVSKSCKQVLPLCNRIVLFLWRV